MFSSKAHKARRGRRAGFTLIELLAVVLILGILVAVAVPLYLSSVRNAGQNAIKANIKQVATAAQAYRVKFGRYPATSQSTADASAPGGTFIASGQDMEQVPSGPRGVVYGWQRVEGSGTTAETFKIAATETTDTNIINTADTKDSVTYNLGTGAYSADATATAAAATGGTAANFD